MLRWLWLDLRGQAAPLADEMAHRTVDTAAAAAGFSAASAAVEAAAATAAAVPTVRRAISYSDGGASPREPSPLATAALPTVRQIIATTYGAVCDHKVWTVSSHNAFVFGWIVLTWLLLDLGAEGAPSMDEMAHRTVGTEAAAATDFSAEVEAAAAATAAPAAATTAVPTVPRAI